MPRTYTSSSAAREQTTHLVCGSFKRELEHAQTCLSLRVCLTQHPRNTLRLFRELNCHTMYVYIIMLHVDFSSHHGFLFSHRIKQVVENFHFTCLHYLHPVWFRCFTQSKQNQSLLSKKSANRYLFFGPLIFFDQVCRLNIIVS